MDERQEVAGYGPFDIVFRLVADLRFLKLGGGKQSLANCESLDRPSPGANCLCAARVALQAAAIWRHSKAAAVVWCRTSCKSISNPVDRRRRGALGDSDVVASCELQEAHWLTCVADRRHERTCHCWGDDEICRPLSDQQRYIKIAR